MSWKDAKEAASQWLRSLNLPAQLDGQIIDFADLSEKLTHEGAFRIMVLRAAKRELRARGAKIKTD